MGGPVGRTLRLGTIDRIWCWVFAREAQNLTSVVVQASLTVKNLEKVPLLPLI